MTHRLDVRRYRSMTTTNLREMVANPRVYDEDQRKVARKVLDERHCDQCQMVAILGSPTHEHGCPNARRQRQRECRECGNEIPEGEVCDCQAWPM